TLGADGSGGQTAGDVVVLGVGADEGEDPVLGKGLVGDFAWVPVRRDRPRVTGVEVGPHAGGTEDVRTVDPEQVTDLLEQPETDVELDAAVRSGVGEQPVHEVDRPARPMAGGASAALLG